MTTNVSTQKGHHHHPLVDALFFFFDDDESSSSSSSSRRPISFVSSLKKSIKTPTPQRRTMMMMDRPHHHRVFFPEIRRRVGNVFFGRVTAFDDGRKEPRHRLGTLRDAPGPAGLETEGHRVRRLVRESERSVDDEMIFVGEHQNKEEE